MLTSCINRVKIEKTFLIRPSWALEAKTHRNVLSSGLQPLIVLSSIHALRNYWKSVGEVSPDLIKLRESYLFQSSIELTVTLFFLHVLLYLPLVFFAYSRLHHLTVSVSPQGFFHTGLMYRVQQLGFLFFLFDKCPT